MANMLYDKSVRLPPAGSLREALFMTVYLMREEAELYRTRILAQGLINLGSDKDMKATADVYAKFVEALLPFTAKQKSAHENKMREMMKKEAEKGMILFKPHLVNPLRDRAKTMSLPDDFREKLAAKRKS